MTRKPIPLAPPAPPAAAKRAPTLPSRIERLAPREAAYVTEVAYLSAHSPILFKLKNGELRAIRPLLMEYQPASLVRSACRLLDVSYAAVMASRAEQARKEAEALKARKLAAAKAAVRAAGYTVTPKKKAR